MKLIHPIYLDIPMLVAFSAAMDGGVSFDSEITEERNSKNEDNSQLKGRVGIGKLLHSFFDAGLDTSVEQTKGNDSKKKVRESRTHTEASLAILLYEQISKNRECLLHPKSQEELMGAEPGALVEVGGTLQKNAIDFFIDTMHALDILSGGMPKPQERGQKLNRNDLEQLRKALEKDRERTPIANVVVHCDTPKSLKAVVALRRDNLRDLTLSELHKNAVRVVGKVTRVIGENDSIVPFENYGMAILGASKLKETFDGISTIAPELDLEFGEVVIKGPAVRILPLMIYV